MVSSFQREALMMTYIDTGLSVGNMVGLDTGTAEGPADGV